MGICSGYPWLVGGPRDEALSAFLIKQRWYRLDCCVWCLWCLCVYFRRREKMRQRQGDIERKGERWHCPGAASYYLHNVMLNSKHCSLIPAGEPWCYYVPDGNMPSPCINLPLNPKKCLSSQTWPRNVKWLWRSVLRWEEIMQGTNLLAEVINHKLFYSDSQSNG